MTVAEQLDLDLHSSEPLHSQVQWALMELIDSDRVSGAVPSPGQLARDLRVCTGSIRRAYLDLVDAGVLVRNHLNFAVADFGEGVGP